MNAIGVNDFLCVGIRKIRKYKMQYPKISLKVLYFLAYNLARRRKNN